MTQVTWWVGRSTLTPFILNICNFCFPLPSSPCEHYLLSAVRVFFLFSLSLYLLLSLLFIHILLCRGGHVCAWLAPLYTSFSENGQPPTAPDSR